MKKFEVEVTGIETVYGYEPLNTTLLFFHEDAVVFCEAAEG